uniref:AAA+ ATPase domain-containing protein n=2 Tax=Auxenochlorella protothecoides TaxID=3075 RepID=A0A1D1ZXG7_AUXPR
MRSFTARATYTCDGHKKLRHNRKWLDGFLNISETTVALLNEDRSSVLGSCRPDGPTRASLLEGEEVLLVNPSILVVMDTSPGLPDPPRTDGTGPSTASNGSISKPRLQAKARVRVRPNPVLYLPEPGDSPGAQGHVQESAAPCLAHQGHPLGSEENLHPAGSLPRREAQPGAPSLQAKILLPSTAQAQSGVRKRFLPPAVVSTPAPQLRPSDGPGGPLLACPVPTTAAVAAAQRTVTLPDVWPSAAAYMESMALAVREEVSLRVVEVLRNFHAAIAAAPQDSAAPPSSLRMHGLRYYSPCDLISWAPKASSQEMHRRGKLQRACADGGSDLPSERMAGASICLVLPKQRGPSSEYRRDDIWILSNDAWLGSRAERAGRPMDRLHAPWVALARSLWHGPNQEGRLAIEFLTDAAPRLGRQQTVTALKGPECSSELGMLSMLCSPPAHSLPLLAPLMSPPHCIVGPSDPDADGAQGQAGLNAEQLKVLRVVASWQLHDDAPAPICLVHGPFGSGKSTLLVTLLRFLLRARTVAGSPLEGARILVSSGTNVAVDRVLMGLLEAGCTDFLRLGPLKRIDRRLLPYSLHASKTKATGISELKEMIKATTSQAEACLLRAELLALEAGAERTRRHMLSTVPIVGVTCYSSMLPVLDGQVFAVTILDECSQLVEPLSLSPIIRAQSRYLIAVGDPLQLPPIVATPTAVAPAGGEAGPALQAGARPTARHGLARPMFVRLAAAGHPVHLLRRQYRCHPVISQIPNRCFYGGQLLDGCSASQRGPVLPGLPPRLWIDPRGGESGGERGARSVTNRREADVICSMVQQLLGHGVPPSAIGIICFFRAQVALLQGLLNPQPPMNVTPEAGQGVAHGPCTVSEAPQGPLAEQAGVQVATVDAFQGGERDVIILSTCVTRPSHFVGDPQRLCVALTRARCHLFLVGSPSALSQSAPAFQALLASCHSLPGCFSTTDRLPIMEGRLAA